MHGYARESGREPTAIGIEGRVDVAPGTGPEDWVTEIKAWEDLGATHLSVRARLSPGGSPDDYINAIQRFKSEVSW